MKSIYSIIFVLLLNLPSLINLEHFLNFDHHEVCEEVKLHFHEKESTCVSCEFNRNFQDVNFENKDFKLVNTQSFNLNFPIKNLIFSSQYFLSSYSRGPPLSYFI
ncbi:hypothetical protein OAA78_03635 [Flavobacteriaceae bacterium]|nr:hypothetical protein [Flavobacteriaceae bacterium]MDC1493045.1 hypothetical protein [Flavobacteriaceae bacterium]